MAVSDKGKMTFGSNILDIPRGTAKGHPRDFMLDYRKAIKVATGKVCYMPLALLTFLTLFRLQPTFYLKSTENQGLVNFDMMVSKGEYNF